MAYLHNPNDPYRPDQANEELRRAAPLDNELQADPELAEGRASGGRIAVIAVALALVLGMVFYGLNNSSMNPTTTATTSSTTTPAAKSKAASPDQNLADQTRPPLAPGVRDVTPYNTQPGTTTGAAPARPQQPLSTDNTTNQKAPQSSTSDE